jgi:hypothetical protein
MDSWRDDERDWYFDCGARGVDAAKTLRARKDVGKSASSTFLLAEMAAQKTILIEARPIY